MLSRTEESLYKKLRIIVFTEEEKNALSFTIQATLTTAGGVPVVGYPVQDGLAGLAIDIRA